MASLYKNKDTWYLAINHNGKRLTRSLKTKEKKVAKRLKLYVDQNLLLNL